MTFWFIRRQLIDKLSVQKENDMSSLPASRNIPGKNMPGRVGKEVRQEAQEVIAEVGMARLMGQAANWLATEMMEDAVQLHEHKLNLAAAYGKEMSVLLTEFQTDALNLQKKIQRNLFQDRV